MYVVVTTVGGMEHVPIEWPEGWPIPPVGAEISVPQTLKGPDRTMWVRTVEWLPIGSRDPGGFRKPHIYMVLGPQRQVY